MSVVASHPYEFKLIPARQIKVNRLYQRNLRPEVIKHIINNFDYHSVNPVKVVMMHGEWYAFDGQNTAAGLFSLFGNDYLVPCMVYYDLPNWDEQAKAFENTNNPHGRKAVSEKETWHSRLFRNEPVATDIKAICEKNGLKLAVEKGKSGNGWVRPLGAVERSYNTLGHAGFDRVCYILQNAWGGAKSSLVAPIINGLTQFELNYHGEYDQAALIKRLKRTPPENILMACKSSVASNRIKYAREILNIYNQHTSVGRLPDKLG